MNINLLNTLKGHSGNIFSIFATKNHFFSADSSGWVVQWEYNNLQQAKVIAQIPAQIFTIQMLGNQKFLAIGSMKGVIYFIDLKNNAIIEPALKISKCIYNLTFTSYENTLLCADSEGNLSYFNTTTFSLQKQLKISNHFLRHIQIHPFLPHIALISSSDNNIYIIDLQQNKKIQTLIHHTNSVFCSQFSPCGNFIISGGRDASLCIWKNTNNTLQTPLFELFHVVPAHLSTINAISFCSKNPNFFATASRDKSFKIWSFPALQLLKVVSFEKFPQQAHTHSINALVWQNENTLITASDDATLKIWNLDIP